MKATFTCVRKARASYLAIAFADGSLDGHAGTRHDSPTLHLLISCSYFIAFSEVRVRRYHGWPVMALSNGSESQPARSCDTSQTNGGRVHQASVIHLTHSWMHISLTQLYIGGNGPCFDTAVLKALIQCSNSGSEM